LTKQNDVINGAVIIYYKHHQLTHINQRGVLNSD